MFPMSCPASSLPPDVRTDGIGSESGHGIHSLLVMRIDSVPGFEFVQDDFLRSSLASDYRELILCFEQGAFKATQVLGGALVEALLLDFLLSENKVLTKDEAQSLTLENLIDRAYKENLISGRSKEQAMLVKRYRNLIHQGRAMRQKEVADKNGAMTTVALVNMLVEEIAKTRKASYGLTAEQVLAKALRDKSNEAVLPHLVRQMKGVEVVRLLNQVLPDAYLEYDYDIEEYLNQDPILIKLFRMAFDALGNEAKASVVGHTAKGIMEWDGLTLRVRMLAFFRARDLAFASVHDVELIVDYILSWMNGLVTREELEVIGGISQFLSEGQVDKYVRCLVIVSGVTRGPVRVMASRILEQECQFVPERLVESFNQSFNKNAEELSLQGFATRASKIKNLSAMPFGAREVSGSPEQSRSTLSEDLEQSEDEFNPFDDGYDPFKGV